jgi:hypothetical protein
MTAMQKIPHTLKIEMVRIHRREDCNYYEVCLEEASVLMWQSFSCQGCRFFSQRLDPIPVSYEKSVSPLAWEV